MNLLTSCYETDPKQILESPMFEKEYKEMLIVKDI